MEFKEGDFVYCKYINKAGYLKKRIPNKNNPKHDSVYPIEIYPFVLHRREYTKCGRYHLEDENVYLMKVYETYLFRRVFCQTMFMI